MKIFNQRANPFNSVTWSIFILLSSFTLSAQEIRWQDGIQFLHQESQTAIKMKMRMQNRFSFQSEDGNLSNIEKAEFTTRRLRLRLEGHTFDPRFLFRLQLSFTRGDMDWDTVNYPNQLRDAVIGYRFLPQHTLWFGLSKLPGNRQRIISSGAQQFVDRSLVNATFNVDRDQAIQYHGQFFQTRPLWIKFALSNGEGRSQNQEGNNLASTMRIEWLAQGEFKNGGENFEADLERESSIKTSWAIAASHNHQAMRQGGQLGQFLTAQERRNITTLFADFLLKYQGLSFDIEWAKRTSAFPITRSSQYIFNGQGINSQIGYVSEKSIGTALRYTLVKADSDIKDIVGKNYLRQQTYLSLSKYFRGHTIKLQGDLGFEHAKSAKNSAMRESDGQWIGRMQFEIGI